MKESECTQSLRSFLAPYAGLCEEYLRQWLIEPGTPDALAEAARYCVLDGGKRLRPSLVLMSAEAAGQDQPGELTARSAVAVELVHCYSLVHDDLPAMDDDQLRRGRPTAHVRFGEAMAILAGDALLTRAFAVLTEPDTPQAATLVGELARGAGPAGMVAGQAADMGLVDTPGGQAGLEYIHLHKTAALIRAAARMGAICASADQPTLRTVSDYAESLGLAFQLVDDILDVTAQAGQLGKTPGKDEAVGKRTHVAELGLDRARELAGELTERAAVAAARLGEQGRKLRELADLLAVRNH